MSTAFAATPGLAADPRALEALRARGGSDPKGALREAARQFESLFMQEVLKSMRQTLSGEGAIDGGAGEDLATSMLDGQYAAAMSGRPGGLAELIARQLERSLGLDAGAVLRPAADVAPPRSEPAAGAGAALTLPAPRAGVPGRAAADFVREHTAAARAVEQDSGIPAAYLIGQAAHETGWGTKPIRLADGRPSHNLFGIKAGAGWNGPVAEITTTEFEGGVAKKVTARFRAYESPQASFADYARLIGGAPRYRDVARQAEAALAAPQAAASVQGFATGLQRAGYATDPAYADKLARVINTTLALKRAAG
jgi:flagellar protein FlgJ